MCHSIVYPVQRKTICYTKTWMCFSLWISSIYGFVLQVPSPCTHTNRRVQKKQRVYMEIVFTSCTLIFRKKYSVKAFISRHNFSSMGARLCKKSAYICIVDFTGTFEMGQHAEDESSQGYNQNKCFWELQQNNKWESLSTNVQNCFWSHLHN